jgi:UDP-N-acetylglucosamine--N-acetylmuramyl-(pentapeptide) pyrophosphoryl-undecaprenol N-acetylglucosamine transferase
VRVLLAGGGSAGHVEPALATAEALRSSFPGAVVVLLGTRGGLEARLVPARGYRLEFIPRVPLPRRVGLEALTLPARLTDAVRCARRVIRQMGAEAVVGFGGYVSLPAYLAARLSGVPIVVHEANARPGLANRVGALLSRHVAAAVDGTGLPHARTIGLPIRSDISRLDRASARQGARESFGLLPEAPTLLVFGGSQGARRLNEATVAASAALAAAGIQVLHVAGAAHAAGVRAAIGEQRPDRPPYIVVDYLDRMELGYAAADLALCRAGAMTCAELAAVGLPAVYVPLPIGNGEQRRNAAPVVAAGGGWLVADADLDGAYLTRVLPALLSDRDVLDRAARAASGFGTRDADQRLAALIGQVLGAP